MIRLSDLTPDDVAREVLDWCTSHLSSVAFACGLTDPIVAPGGSLAHETRELVHYAQTGEIAGQPSARIQTIVEALYSGAHPDVYRYADVADMAGKAEPEHAIDVVIRAALARELIETGQRVPVAWLACLASLPVQTLRTYGARGEIQIRDGDVTAKRAAEWLSARGVTGFVATK